MDEIKRIRNNVEYLLDDGYAYPDDYYVKGYEAALRDVLKVLNGKNFVEEEK